MNPPAAPPERSGSRWCGFWSRWPWRLAPKVGRASASTVVPVTALDEAMMRRALQLARQAAVLGEVPVGAVAYRGEQVLAEAHNRCEADRDATAHAELLALRRASAALGDWRLQDCSLAVTLEPCAMCAGGVINARVGRLLYGARDPKGGAVESLYRICSDDRLNHRPEVIGGLFADECGRPLSDFFRERRRRKKRQLPIRP